MQNSMDAFLGGGLGTMTNSQMQNIMDINRTGLKSNNQTNYIRDEYRKLDSQTNYHVRETLIGLININDYNTPMQNSTYVFLSGSRHMTKTAQCQAVWTLFDLMKKFCFTQLLIGILLYTVFYYTVKTMKAHEQ